MLKKIGLIAVGVIAAVVLVGAVSAQETTQTPPTNQAQPGPPPAPLAQDGNGQLMGQLLQIVAQDLNLQPQDLLQQLRGKTLSEIITAQNGDVAKITADLVAAVTTRVNQAVTDGQLTQDRANQILGKLNDTVMQALNGQLRGLFPGRLGGQGGFGGQRPGQGGGLGQGRGGFGQVRPDILSMDAHPLLKAIQDALGLTPQQIGDEMRGGKTLNDVITAHNGDPTAIIDAAIATATQRLDDVRAKGTLTQDQENAMLGGLKAFYQALLNGAFRPQNAPTTTTTAAGTTT